METLALSTFNSLLAHNNDPQVNAAVIGRFSRREILMAD
jgi:hypothetical protein